MILTIGRLHVRTRMPARLRTRASATAQLVRDVLPQSASRHLNRLPQEPAVARIRRLYVRVRLTAAELDARRLGDAWSDAFARALIRAINQPPEMGGTLASGSAETWFAEVTIAILDGRLSEWAFDEFEPYRDLPASSAIVSLVRDHEADWPAVLAHLARKERLDRLIYALGVDGCRQVVPAIAGRRAWSSLTSLDELGSIADLIVRQLATVLHRESLDMVTVRLVAAAADDGGRASTYSPEALRSAIAAIGWLSRHLRQPSSAFTGRYPALPVDELHGAPALLGVIASAYDALRRPDPPANGPLASMRELLPVFANADESATAVTVTDSPVAGLFLLVPVLDRARWAQKIRASMLGAAYGANAVTYVLTGTALAILGRAPTGTERVDPGVSRFAGWLDDADPSALRRLAREQGREAWVDLVRCLAGDAVESDLIAGWDLAFSVLGTTLVRQFAERLRGFSRSTERFIVERMLAAPGRLEIDEHRVLVRLHSNAFWPVIRLSGADAPVDAVSWLGGRQVAFELQGV